MSGILITGFGPFGSVADDPSSRLAASSGLPHCILPVSYLRVEEELRTLEPFDTLLMMGVAARRSRPTLELLARNRIGRSPDVDGMRGPSLIEPDGPPVMEATLGTGLSLPPGIGASLDAGDYLCNYVLWRALRLFPTAHVGFLHVPPFSRLDEAFQTRMLAALIQRL